MSSEKILAIKKILLVYLLALLSGCDANPNQHQKEFAKYLHDVFHESLNPTDTLIFYVINLNECMDCIDEHFNALNLINPKPNVTFIVVGRTAKESWKKILHNLEWKGSKILNDKLSLALQYDFGLQKPLFLEFVDGELIRLIKIQDEELLKVISMIKD